MVIGRARGFQGGLLVNWPPAAAMSRGCWRPLRPEQLFGAGQAAVRRFGFADGRSGRRPLTSRLIPEIIKYCGGLCALAAVALTTGCASIRPPAGARSVERQLLVTAYCKCQKCCGWQRSGLGRPVYSSGPAKGKPKQVGVTASGAKARQGTIAADLSLYPFRTIMYVPDYGYGRVEDCGGGVQGNHIEVFFNSHNKALQWGKQTRRVEIWFP